MGGSILDILGNPAVREVLGGLMGAKGGQGGRGQASGGLGGLSDLGAALNGGLGGGRAQQGGGGLGDIAIRYGYQSYNTEYLILCSVILIIFVQLVQMLGNWMYKKLS